MKSQAPEGSRSRRSVASGNYDASARPFSTDGRPHRPPPAEEPTRAPWTFLTNHSHVLILLDRHPTIVLREVAAKVGITERAVQRIIADLEAGGFIEREKIGRQNRYRIVRSLPLRHPIEAHRSIGDLLSLVKM